jgi:hypothetical protein
MPSYQTVPLQNYDQSFQNVAEELFRRIPVRAGGTIEKGSYSFKMSNYSKETIGKIVIYQRGLGVEMQGQLPWLSNGVYVLIRTSNRFGTLLWNDLESRILPGIARVRRDADVSIAPNFEERFAHFPVMAGENLGWIADLVAYVVDCADELGLRCGASATTPPDRVSTWNPRGPH